MKSGKWMYRVIYESKFVRIVVEFLVEIIEIRRL